jgi:hypothetical protein
MAGELRIDPSLFMWSFDSSVSSPVGLHCVNVFWSLRKWCSFRPISRRLGCISGSSTYVTESRISIYPARREMNEN